MLSNELENLYDEVLIVSPTFKYQKKAFAQLDPRGVLVYSRTLDSSVLRNIAIRRKMEPGRNVLLVLDDVGEVREPGSNTFQKQLSDFIFVSRHLRTSVVFLQQKLTSLPTAIRSQADFVLSFSTMAAREKEALYNECTCTPTFKQFDAIFTAKTSKPFSYIIVSVQDGVPKIY
jgi:hypothetical protein